MSDIPRGAIRFNTDSNKPELWDGSQWAEFQLSTPNLGTNLTSTGSVVFSGATKNRLTIPSSSDFAFGTGDFTIEMFVYHTDLTGQQTYFGDTFGGTAGIYTYKTSDNAISLYDDAQRSVSSNSVIQLNTWHHVAWARASGTLKAFLDGVEVDSDSYSGDFTTTEYFIGDTASTSSGEMIGFISNVRIIKGTALYTASFSRPVTELTNVTNTKLLCCQSKTSATAAAVTPGTLVATSASASSFGPFTPDTQPGARGVISESHSSTIGALTYINISSTGNAISFGNLSTNRYSAAGLGSRTRGVFGSGYIPSPSSSLCVIDFVTISSTGNATLFGELSYKNYVPASFSNETRGIWAGGFNFPAGGQQNDVSYVTIASTGDAQDFGDLITAGNSPRGFASPTRGVLGGGQTPTKLNRIEFVTIATTGAAQDFGELEQAIAGVAGASSPVRGLFGGGYTPTVLNTIQYVTIATTGNSANFGDLTQVGRQGGATSDSRRAVFCGRFTPSVSNVIDYVQIVTEGNAVDFGDTTSGTQASATSSGHGGL